MIASLLLVLVYFARAYFPTNPSLFMPFLIARVSEGGWAFLFFYRTLTCRFPRFLLIKNRFFKVLVRLVLVAPLAASIAYQIAISSFIFAVQTPVLFSFFILFELALLFFTVFFWLKKSIQFPLVRLLLAVVVLMHGCLALVLLTYLWRPPSVERCKSCEQPGLVERITDPRLFLEYSYPYNLLYIPEENMLAASFKMAGNLTLNFWDKKEANYLVLIDVSDEKTTRAARLNLPYSMLPERMVYHLESRQVFVTLVGAGTHALEAISVENFPDLKSTAHIPIPFEPNGLLLSSDHKQLHVVGFDMEHLVIDVDNLRTRKLSLFEFGPMIIFEVWRRPGEIYSFWTSFGKTLIRYNLQTQDVKTVRVKRSSSGHIVDGPKSGIVYQTDVVTNSLNIIDGRNMKFLKNMPLPYKPRPIELAEDLGILFIIDWFDGDLHFYDSISLEELGETLTINAGPYSRHMAYDPIRKVLYISSKCGVYQVRLKKILNTILMK